MQPNREQSGADTESKDAPTPITGWILQAGEIESPDPGDHGKRLPRCVLVQFDTTDDCMRVTRGAAIQLKWIWDRAKPLSSSDTGANK